MKKVVISKDGDFGISMQASQWLIDKGHADAIAQRKENENWISEHIEEEYNLLPYYPTDRSDPLLIECIETLGSELASGDRCKLRIIEIPDDLKFHIEASSNGNEILHENHRTWE